MILRLLSILAAILAATFTLSPALAQSKADDNQTHANIEAIDADEGFLQNSVLDIHQDKQGYLWFSTPNGIYRYDGYKFEIYYNEPGDQTSPSSSSTHLIKEWFDGELAMQSGNTLNIYMPQSELFHQLHLSNKRHQARLLDFEIEKGDSARVWVLWRNKIKILPLSKDRKSIDSHAIELANNYQFRQITIDSNGYIWLLSATKICAARLLDNQLEILFSYALKGANDLILDSSGQIITHTDNEVVIINHNSLYSDFDVEHIEVVSRAKGATIDQVLISSSGDIVCVDWDKWICRFSSHDRKPKFTDIVESSGANKLFKYNRGFIDQSGILWVGTLHGGLYKINLNPKPFSSLKGEYINQITGDNEGNIWYGTHYAGVRHANARRATQSGDEVNRALGLDQNSSIFALDYYDQQLWYATTTGTISRASIGANASILSREEVYHATPGLGFFYRSRGQLFYAVFNGEDDSYIYLCNNSSRHNASFKQLTLEQGNSLKLGGIASLLVDSYGTLWVGTSGGELHRYRFTSSYQLERIGEIELPAEVAKCSIFGLYEDYMSNLYMGLFGGGMITAQITKESIGNFEHYTRKSGLANNAVYSIRSIDDRYIWISTDEGISRFDATNKTFRNYDNSDGIRSLNFRKWSSWESSNGVLFFGGVGGVNHFSPQDIAKNRSLPRIAVTNFSVGGQSRCVAPYIYWSERADRDIEPYILKPNENNFSIEFAALHFDNPSKNRYEYRLEGIDKSWHKVGASSRSVTYSGVDKGNYKFMVRGSNSDGVWTQQYAALNIRILPYWWQTTFAKMVYTAIILMLIVFIYLFTILRHKHRLSTQLNQAKLDFFTNVSHEIKTPLTIISGALEISSDGHIPAKNVEIIKRNNSRMLSLVTQLLDFRKVTQGHAPFCPLRGDIVPIIENISQSFELLAQSNNIEYSLQCDTDHQELCFEPDKIEKIVTNLLSNAFKHTPAQEGKITLSLCEGLPDEIPAYIAKQISQSSDMYITISVRDNGEGVAAENHRRIFDQFYQINSTKRPQKQRGVGVGLAYSKLLTELHEGYIYVDSQIGCGSNFVVILPKELQHASPVGTIESSARDSVEFLLPPKTSHEISQETRETEASSEQHDSEILIVEDNQEIREFLREVLSPLYTIHEAANGRQGLEIAEKLLPDLIISDVMMPEMDGITLCNRLKSNEKINHIPIILLTANSSIDHRLEGLRSGADSYIPKPFNLEHLKIRISKLLESRSLLKQKYMQQSGFEPLEQIDINSADKEFLTRVETFIEDNLDDSEFTVERLEQAMRYTHMQLYRKIKSISGVTVVEFIRNYRLKRSVDMMRQGGMRINEIMYSVGFATPSYYSKSFKRRYGKSPAEFLEELRASQRATIDPQ